MMIKMKVYPVTTALILRTPYSRQAHAGLFTITMRPQNTYN